MFGLNIPPKLRSAEIERLIQRPEAQKIFAAMEKEELQTRRLLIEKLHAMDNDPARIEAEAELGRQIAEASAATTRAKVAWQAACRHEEGLHCMNLATSNQAARERLNIERALVEGADPRLRDFHGYVESMSHNQLRGCLVSWADTDTTLLTATGERSVRYFSNADEIKNITAILSAAMADTISMQREALSQSEITNRLNSWCAKMRAGLDNFGLKPPVISADNILPGQALWDTEGKMLLNPTAKLHGRRFV